MSRLVHVLRRGLSRCARQAGFTVMETAIVCALLGIVTSGVLTSLNSATEAAHFSSVRNQSLDQLRIMAANFTKDVRQATGATAIDTTSFSSVTMNTYVDGSLQSVRWQVVTTDGERQMQRTVGSGTPATYVVDLTADEVFSYFGHTDPTAVNRVQLNLATKPDPRHPEVELATVVEMRNVP